MQTHMHDGWSFVLKTPPNTNISLFSWVQQTCQELTQSNRIKQTGACQRPRDIIRDLNNWTTEGSIQRHQHDRWPPWGHPALQLLKSWYCISVAKDRSRVWRLRGELYTHGAVWGGLALNKKVGSRGVSECRTRSSLCSHSYPVYRSSVETTRFDVFPVPCNITGFIQTTPVPTQPV